MGNSILSPIVGLTLFLYGMFHLNSVVQRFFSVRIRDYIRKIVKKPLYGVFVGLISAISAQSSSAANALTVGMVSAGLITFYQALGIVLGAGLGSTVNAQLIAFRFTEIAPFFIIIGFLVWSLAQGKKKILGEMIFYFGLLFFGLNLVEMSGEIFKHSHFLLTLLSQAQTPIIGLLIGIVAAIVLQTSSIPIGLLIIFAQQGIVGTESALPIVLGACLGTSIDLTELTAALTAKRSGQRVSLANFLFKLLGIIILMPFLGSFIHLLKTIYIQPSYQIALGNIFYALLVTIIGLIIIKPVYFLIKKIIPGEQKDIILWPEYLNEKNLSQPKLALNDVKMELARMAEATEEMYLSATGLLRKFKVGDFRQVEYIELVADNLQKEILSYLDKLSEEKLMSREESSQMLYFSIMVDDIERIADLSLNVAKLARYQARYRIRLSPEAENELNSFIKLDLDSINNVIKLLNQYQPELIKEIIHLEEKSDRFYSEYRQNHFERFFANKCSAEAGPIFIETLSNLERISDHCKNIADYWREYKEKYV